MNSFDFYSPTYFIFGKDRECEVGAYIRKFGGSRVMLVSYGGNIMAELMGRVRSSLAKEGLEVTELSGVKPNPRSGLVYEGIELCRKNKVDFLLAVGGGSVIDTAKAVAMGTVYDGDFWDFFSGKAQLTKALPIGTIQTLAGTGSEGSPDAIITNEKTMDKSAAGNDCIRPRFSVMNPALTQTLPPFQTACGVTDIISHALERYFTNTPDVELTDRLLEGVVLTMLHEGRRVMENPANYEARANIMWAGMVVHNDIMGVGRQQDWNSHHLEHVMSSLYDCAHGAGIAVIMPAWMEYCVKHHDPMRMAGLASRVFGCEMDYADPARTAMDGVRAFRVFLKSIGMPLNFAGVGADPKDIEKLVEMNHVGSGKTKGFVELDAAAIREIYELAANCEM